MGRETKHKEQSICIVGAGRSLCELPRDYVFPCDTMALNVSTIAPQFYDMETESFWQSWNYAMFIDSNIKNKKYFPEYYYFQKSINNPDGVVYIPDRPAYWGGVDGKNIVKVKLPSTYKTVLLAALGMVRSLGYGRIILLGCDFCRIDLYRYWWETDDAILNHPANRSALIKAEREKYIVKESGKVKVVDRKFKHNQTTTSYCKDTGGNKVLCDNLYRRQIDSVMEMIEKLEDEGIYVAKYLDIGMLNIPVVKSMEA